MKKLNVLFYREKKEKFPVGQLAESGNRIYFEYDPAFLAAPYGSLRLNCLPVLGSMNTKTETLPRCSACLMTPCPMAGG
jgi:hypothetical protein